MNSSGSPESRASVVKDHMAAKSVMAGPGQRLRRAREAMGFTEAYVAQQLRISADIIKAIDKDDYRFGARLIYLKGYLKSYAKLVNLSADEILLMFSELEVPEPPAIHPEIPLIQQLPGRFTRYLTMPKWIWPVTVLVGVTIAIGWWHTHEFKRRLNMNVGMEMDELHVPAHVSPRNAEDIQVHLPQPPQVTAEPVVKPTAAVAAIQSAGEPAVLAEVKPLQIIQHLPLPARLEFKEACWIKATDAAGQLLYMGIKQPGEHLRLKGAAPVTLTLGNARGVELHYDGGSMDFGTYPPQQIVHMQLGLAQTKAVA